MKIDEKVLSKDISTCFLIYLLQFALLIFSVKAIAPSSTNESLTAQVSIDIEFKKLILQFVCCVILHIQLEGEIRQALNFLNFALYSRDINRKHLVFVFLLSGMQMTTALLTEFLHLYNVFKLTNGQEIVTNLIAFGVIAEVDDYFATSLRKSNVKNESDENKYELQDDEEPIEVMKQEPIKFAYKLIKLFYQCAYYYYFPFITLAFFAWKVDNLL